MAKTVVTGPPTISSVSPHSGSTAGGNTVTINGTDFQPAMTVKFSSTGASLPVTYVSPTQVTVLAPAHAAGTVDVFATDTAGTSAAVNGDLYAFGAPTISSVSPHSGSTAGGNTVTINGTDFQPAMTVKFSSTGSSLPVTYVSPTQVTVLAPAHAAGTVDVFATDAAGTSAAVSADRYTYT
jgi:hypothetical protein